MPANPLNTYVTITQEQFDFADRLMLRIDQAHERVYLAGTLAEKRRMISARSRLIVERQALLALNGEQYEAVKRFVFAGGKRRQWKVDLRAAWETGDYQYFTVTNHDATLLQQVRNVRGPEWLKQFRLPPEGN